MKMVEELNSSFSDDNCFCISSFGASETTLSGLNAPDALDMIIIFNWF